MIENNLKELKEYLKKINIQYDPIVNKINSISKAQLDNGWTREFYFNDIQSIKIGGREPIEYAPLDITPYTNRINIPISKEDFNWFIGELKRIFEKEDDYQPLIGYIDTNKYSITAFNLFLKNIHKSRVIDEGFLQRFKDSRYLSIEPMNDAGKYFLQIGNDE